MKKLLDMSTGEEYSVCDTFVGQLARDFLTPEERLSYRGGLPVSFLEDNKICVGVPEKHHDGYCFHYETFTLPSNFKIIDRGRFMVIDLKYGEEIDLFRIAKEMREGEREWLDSVVDCEILESVCVDNENCAYVIDGAGAYEWLCIDRFRVIWL